MIKKYIKGNGQRGAEVIKALKELGGKNSTNLTGKFSNCFYYIKEYNEIDIANESSTFGKLMQEYFEEIKLPEQHNVAIKEPKQIYWFRATEDDAKNQALFDKLCDLVGINKTWIRVGDGIVYFNPFGDGTSFCPNNIVSEECTIAMMVGKELVIEQ